MPPLLPSEVARLVYGQLVSCNCASIAERFLNESPHLEECREFVERVGKPSFIVKAYGLSLHQILERYLEMWNLILERTNDVLPETREKFADPVDALEFLISAYSRTANEILNRELSSDNLPHALTAEDIAEHTGREPSHRQIELHDSSRSCADVSEWNGFQVAISEDVTTAQQSRSPLKLKKRRKYLDKLYALIEAPENPGSKKRLKVLKPRHAVINRPDTTHSAPSEAAASDSNSSEDKSRSENESSHSSHHVEAFVHDEKCSGVADTPQTKLPEPAKRTNMQLRSSSKVTDQITQQASDDKNVRNPKKRKCSCSPERESVARKQPKTSKSTCGKENDAQVDFTKIPQLLIEDPKWPELIAENINKKILESPQKKIDTSTEDKDNVIKSIAEKTLEDRLMDEFIQDLLNCQPNIAQEKDSAIPDVSLLDEHPYETNITCENNTAANQIPGNVDVVHEVAVPSPTEKSEQLFSGADYSRLHADMNEFVHFNNPKPLPGGQSDIIVVEMNETEPDTSNLVAESQIRAAHSNYVVCSTDEKEMEDEIINLCAESDGADWNAPTTSTASTAANTKLQIRGPVSSPSKTMKRNYRPIAPKPNSVMSRSHTSAATPGETNSQQMKSKSIKRTKK